MKRFLIAAFVAVQCCAGLRTADANHGEPRPIQIFPSAFFFDADGMIHNVVHSNTSDEDNFVFGWIWDENDPNHTWQAVDSIYEHVGETIPPFGSDNAFSRFSKFHLYNASRVTLEQTNKKLVRNNPNFAFGAGPGVIELFDRSNLLVDDSYIGAVFADGDSSATIKNTKPSGSFIMQSHGTMTLVGISPGLDIFGNLQGSVVARSGTTNISDSTIPALTAEDSGSVMMTGGVVREQVFCGGNSGDPHVALDGTTVGSLDAVVGSIEMSGGIVQGSATAEGTSAIALSGGQVQNNVVAHDSATLNITGTDVLGNLSASTDGLINMSGGRTNGIVFASGDAIVNLSGLSNIGDGDGIALQSRNDSFINVTGTSFISGDVFAENFSRMNLSSVRQIVGNVVASGSVNLELVDTSIAGTINASGGNSTLHIVGGEVVGSAISFQSGTIDLAGVAVTGSVQALDSSRLIFDNGSHASHEVAAYNSASVTVRGGTIDLNLVGTGDSITAMSGGHVVGFPVFLDHAKFLYFGGTFDFFGIPQAGGGSSERALAGGAGGEPTTPLQGFTALDEAEIDFIGFGLQSTLVDPNFDGGKFSLYQLTGRLADGSHIDGKLVYVQNQTGASFQLLEATVPEPSAVAVMVALVIAGNLPWRRAR